MLIRLRAEPYKLAMPRYSGRSVYMTEVVVVWEAVSVAEKLVGRFVGRFMADLWAALVTLASHSSLVRKAVTLPVLFFSFQTHQNHQFQYSKLPFTKLLLTQKPAHCTIRTKLYQSTSSCRSKTVPSIRLGRLIRRFVLMKLKAFYDSAASTLRVDGSTLSIKS